MPPASPMPPFSADQRRRIERIAMSYERLAGRPLVARSGDLVEALWTAPFAIVAHGTEPDPIFFFGNATALELFETDYAAFTQLPSRYSAEPLLRDERSRLLDRVSSTGLIDDYTGVRISMTGRRFHIRNASVWNLATEDGAPAGQAAAFAQWTHLN